MLTCIAPAKLNLFLHILSKRPDGYHNLATLFALLDWGDELSFSTREDNEITIKGCAGISQADNLIYKAIQLLKQQITGIQAKNITGVDITVKKNIPQGAGLGGGSSNAATTLLALNKLWNAGLSKQDLMCLGSQLGADVGFFLQQTNLALGFGRGDELLDVTGPELWHVIAMPPASFSTKDMFANKSLIKQGTINANVADLQKTRQVDIKAINQMGNDFYSILGSVDYIKTSLNILNSLPQKIQQQVCLGARISGSGSSVFMSFKDYFWAKSAYDLLLKNTISSKIVFRLTKSI